MLASVRRIGAKGATSEEIVEFLEASFGAFQAGRDRDGWRWDRNELLNALHDMESHGLVANIGGIYILAELGRLAGESATEVDSIIRLVECLRDMPGNQIGDPDLIAAAQITVELDQVLFPINKKTPKELQFWSSELRGQLTGGSLLSAFHRNVTDSHQPTLRAKKNGVLPPFHLRPANV